MKVVFIDWNGYGNERMIALMEKRGYTLIKCSYDQKAAPEKKASYEKDIASALEKGGVDYVFSYNYVPAISNICQDKNVPYISWIYDSPFMNLYSFTVPNPVNRIFVFDYGVYSQFEKAGINTVHYLPLGVDEGFYKKICGEPGEKSMSYDISMVGSLYTEPKHRLYDKFDSVSSYTKGYLDAIISAQKHIYGENILEGLLKNDVLAEMEKAYPCDPNPTTVMSPRQIYSQFVLSRQVTSIERREILEMLGQTGDYRRSLFTNDASVKIDGWRVNGPVDYYKEMPQIFASSRINLNITLRSILTGIPLRAFDIMGAGGLLVSNYQMEYGEYFTPGEDLVIYESYSDLMEKVEYLLTHEKERAEITENGCRKVRTEHTLEKRLDMMESGL